MPEPAPQPAPAAPTKQPEIHVMPERFIGAAAAYREPKRPAPAAPGAPAAPAAAKKPPLVLFVIIGVVVLAGLGVGGWLLFGPKPKPAPTPAVNRPAPAIRNANRPANVNAPANINANVNANIPANVNAPTNVNANVPVVPPPPLRSSTDSDVDGLTDSEERLYGTGITRPDTDGDGFLDGNEVFHLYNPAALAPTTLRDSGLVRIHEDTSRGFEILYPAAWTRRVLDETTGTTTFTASSGEFIQMLVENNSAGLEIAEWYLSRSPGVTRAELESITTKNGYAAVRSPDRLTTYIAKDSRVFIISYNIGNLPEISFRQTYEMMINSFRVTAVSGAPVLSKIDCGTDYNCFISASTNCNPASVRQTLTLRLFGEQTSTSYQELRGMEQGLCIFYLKMENIDVVFPPETSPETVAIINEGNQKLEGRDGVCKYNTEDLVAVLKRWNEEQFSSNDFEGASCEGSYFSKEL